MYRTVPILSIKHNMLSYCLDITDINDNIKRYASPCDYRLVTNT